MPQTKTKKLILTAFTNIRMWYKETYPTDEFGDDIDENVSFDGMMQKMYEKRDVSYIYPDSLVRERIFAAIASIYAVPYGVIYNLWLEGE